MNTPMTVEEQLAELRDLTEENNRLIKAVRRDAIIGGVVKTALWLGLILLSFYFSLKFIEPYLASFNGGEAGGMNPENIQSLIDMYKSQVGQ